ncbi:hypothetical protein WH8501_16285 [Crocosphaera watsonii WH 8501]|uniref:Uncharacterized protein n=1 Tax=Crocosphaera watsonii WH 8501 TaxID=165597 RepID=Q4C8Y3_CROWT|nr:hypothetical protein [Crocosphaera watsonii]EAM52138.1 hypothetical protein CwatDRAFT_5298 [Crocosphaera watsonii WH 8501]
MDPITTAIIAALADLSKQTIKDSYNALKEACKKKFSETSDLAKAVDNLENKPDSKGRQETLKEEIEAVNAHQDPEIIQLAQALLEKIKEQSPAQKNITMGNVTTKGEGNTTIANLKVEGQVRDIGGIHGKK